jgi:hypothetical protein
MTKDVWLYSGSTEMRHRYENCTDVTHDGGILSFTDRYGSRHTTNACWDVVVTPETLA